MEASSLFQMKEVLGVANSQDFIVIHFIFGVSIKPNLLKPRAYVIISISLKKNISKSHGLGGKLQNGDSINKDSKTGSKIRKYNPYCFSNLVIFKSFLLFFEC